MVPFDRSRAAERLICVGVQEVSIAREHQLGGRLHFEAAVAREQTLFQIEGAYMHGNRDIDKP